MYKNILFAAFAIAILLSVQIAFINNLPTYFNTLNLILIILIYILALSEFKNALWWAIGIGLGLDIISFLPFGIYILSLVLTTIICYLLLYNFFTNRTLYIFLAFTVFFTATFKLIFFSINYLIKIFNIDTINFYFDLAFWQQQLYGILINMLAVLVVFYALNFASNKLKPVFLRKK
jgi:rod shape-determining protein MreD